MKRSVISLLLFALLGRNAFSLPNIDSVTDGGILSGNFESGILLKDHADSHIHYYSLDRLALSKDEDGVPEFSFSYTPSGALISFSVIPTTDKAALQKAKEAIKKTDSLAEFRALSLREGAYSLSFQTKSDEQVIEAGESVVADDTANPWSVQLSLPKAEADSIVTSLVTGAVVGINFRYRFQAATSPNLVKVKIRKNALLPALKSASRQTDSSFSRLFNRLKEQKTVEVYIAGQDTSLASALWLASQYLKEKCFTSVGTKDLAKGYRYDEMKCEAALPPEIELQSADRMLVTASAGMSIGGMCERYRTLFSYTGANGAIRLGCPDRVLPDAGTPVTEQNEPRELVYKPLFALPAPASEAP